MIVHLNVPDSVIMARIAGTLASLTFFLSRLSLSIYHISTVEPVWSPLHASFVLWLRHFLVIPPRLLFFFSSLPFPHPLALAHLQSPLAFSAALLPVSTPFPLTPPQPPPLT